MLNLDKPISTLEKKSKDSIYKHEEHDVKNLKFRSRKFVIEEDKIFPGKAAYFDNVQIESFNADPIPIINKKDFWNEMDFFWITEDQNLPLTNQPV